MEFKRKQPPLVEAAQGDTTGNWKSQLDRSGDMHKKIDNQCGTMAHQVKPWSHATTEIYVIEPRLTPLMLQIAVWCGMA